MLFGIFFAFGIPFELLVNKVKVDLVYILLPKSKLFVSDTLLKNKRVIEVKNPML